MCRIKLVRCTFTIDSVIPMSLAICLFNRPLATWIMISRSERSSAGSSSSSCAANPLPAICLPIYSSSKSRHQVSERFDRRSYTGASYLAPAFSLAMIALLSVVALGVVLRMMAIGYKLRT